MSSLAPTHDAAPPSAWFTKLEAAERLRCSLLTVERRIKAGDLPTFRMAGGRKVLLRVEDVDALVEPVA